MTSTLTRKALLAGAAGAAVAATTGSSREATAAGAPLKAVFRKGTLPLESPFAAVWRLAEPVTVAVLPQQMATPMLHQAGISSIRVRALYSADELGRAPRRRSPAGPP